MRISPFRRLLLALAVSPAVLPAAVFAFALHDGVRLKEAIVVAAVYAAFTYSLTLLLGLPAHALLTRWGLTSVWSYAAAGVLLGILILTAFLVKDGGAKITVFSVLVFGGFGAATAIVFWKLADPRDA